jgi:hypothetical protein
MRLALALGDEAPQGDSRHGLVLSLEVHPTWMDPNFNWMMLFGVGADMFNVFNTVVFGGIQTNITNTNFGRVSSQTNTPRVVQLKFRVEF